MGAHARVHRLELRLHKPRLGWWPKPTVAVNGSGQPSQWGVGTWQVSKNESTVVTVYLFNRVWRFGRAEIVIQPDEAVTLIYEPPLLPIGRGSIRRVVP